MSSNKTLSTWCALVLGFSLAGCRQLPGECSGAADRLCIIYQAGGQQPDGLTVEAVAGTQKLQQQVSSGLAGALAARGQYVFELDLAPVRAAPSIAVTLSAQRAGTNLGAATQTWQRGQAPTLTFLLSPPGSGSDGAGGSDGGDAGPPTWMSGTTAVAKLTTAASVTLNQPNDVCWNGSKLFISDSNNNRVVYFAADNLSQIGPGNGTLWPAPGTAAPLKNPTGLWCAPGAQSSFLFVADTGNHRVLSFSTSSLNALAVAGQANFQGVCENRAASPCPGTAPAPAGNTLSAPQGVFLDVNARLYIADTGNHRVVGYRAANGSDLSGISAPTVETVLGQADQTSRQDPGAPGQATLKQPVSVSADGSGRLAVMDTGFNRALLYPTSVGLPTGGQTILATAVLGQNGYTGATTGAAASALYAPSKIHALASSFAVADTYNNRALIYNGTLAAAPPNSLSAQFVVGQTGFGQSSAGAGDNQMRTPRGVFLAQQGSDTFLIVADSQNNRVLVFRQGAP